MIVRKIKATTLTLLLLSFSILSYGQLSQGGTPFSFNTGTKGKDGKSIKSNYELFGLKMPKIDPLLIEAIKQKNNQNNGRFQFAYTFDVDLDVKAKSSIDTLDIGILYRYQLESIGAFSINVIFSEYRVPKGAKLFLYSFDNEHVIGSFTSNNNKEGGILPTIPIKGDKVTVEYFEPFFPEFEGKLKIGRIGHDFVGFYQLNGIPNDFGSSGDCQVDVSCSPERLGWENQIRSTLRIVTDGESTCSCALLDNTNEDGTPYILTANHCINNQISTDRSLFIFNYESASCGGGNGSVNQSIAGGTLRATNSNTDFTLIELSKKPLASFSPFYAGWDRTNVQGAGGVGIHHPRGDVKKISTFDMVPVDSDLGFLGCLGKDFWMVNWIPTPNGYGVVEQASSGSPLFNHQGRIIGQLYGVCKWPDNSDFCAAASELEAVYGKISASWNGTTPSERLRDWLDPTNTAFTLDGANGCVGGSSVNLTITHNIEAGMIGLHQASNSLTASNRIKSGAIATYEAPTIFLTTGFTAEQGSIFTAKQSFKCVPICNSISILNWSASGCIGSNLCFSVLNATEYIFKLFNSFGSLVYQNSGIFTGTSVCVGQIPPLAVGNYIANVTFKSDCEELSNAYPFFIMSCKKQEEANSIENTRDVEIDLELLKSDFDFNIFPNPNDGNFSLTLPKSIGYPYSFEIINSFGAIIYKAEHLNTNEINVNQTGLSKGIYYVRMKSGNSIATKKVVIK